jgi:Mn2+/Fe2+ NRAMP family transporter
MISVAASTISLLMSIRTRTDSRLATGLTQARLPFANARQRRTALAMSNREVLLALGAAGLVNMAMIAMAAVAFHDGTHDPRACRFRATLIALTGFSLLAGLQSRNLR